MIEVFISIDPGDDHGGACYALWEMERLAACGPWRAKGAFDCPLVIEDQVIIPRFTRKPASIIVLAHEAGAISACFGGPKSPRVTWVKPSSWKGSCPKPRTAKAWATYVIHRRVEKSLDAKELAVYRQALEAFPEGERHNLADGSGIGLEHIGRLVK